MAATQPVETTIAVAPSTRVMSVDVLRGLTIMLMILVNNSGDGAYWPLHHAQWNGWTPTDMVFPTFLFVMGSSVVFSFRARLAKNSNVSPLIPHILRRFVILFCLGLLVNTFPYFHMDTLRIFGVLQRIAICYLVVSLLFLWNSKPALRIGAIVVILAAYWALMRLVPVPSAGLPVRDIPLLDPDKNLAAWLDRLILPARRLYEGTRDPEGLLSTLPALATTMLGTLTGEWLLSNRSKEKKALGMLCAGVVCALLGELWNPWFPINKKLWTSSYVLLAAGWSLVFLALCYWAIEIKGWKKGWTYPALVFGSNAIVAYVFSELLAPLVWMRFRTSGGVTSVGKLANAALATLHTSRSFAALLYSLLYVLVCFVPVYILYRKKIFIKV
ncbi:MAG TPA: heparan-alpha-glucosaminide N-acetyltransferase domain-containing protein [Acidisarcina sp.]|nr:heparan-alpha-glucosaminide N-acetyltransferase domain-containing protein [Acidisarcina sp.]